MNFCTDTALLHGKQTSDSLDQLKREGDAVIRDTNDKMEKIYQAEKEKIETDATYQREAHRREELEFLQQKNKHDQALQQQQQQFEAQLALAKQKLAADKATFREMNAATGLNVAVGVPSKQPNLPMPNKAEIGGLSPPNTHHASSNVSLPIQPPATNHSKRQQPLQGGFTKSNALPPLPSLTPLPSLSPLSSLDQIRKK